MFRLQPTRRLLALTTRTTRLTPGRATPLISTTRALSTTPRPLYPRKDDQDKDSVSPRRSEYSQTGGDDAAAENAEAFDPSTTRPEQETKEGEKKKSGGANPLDVSPGNTDVSKPRGDEEGGAQGGKDKKSSGAGGAPKAGGGKSG